MRRATERTGVQQLHDAYLEIIPTPGVLDHLKHLPDNTHIGISCSPKTGVGPTLELVDSIAKTYPDSQFRVVPHIAARMVRDRLHLKQIVAQLEGAGVESIFVPGGDAVQAAGVFTDSLQLLRELAEMGHPFEDVGVAAHPEGHPLVNDETLLQFLQEKQGLATYLVTQMCFDAEAIGEWLRNIRDQAVVIPAWLGLPGVVSLPRLLALSLRIGVGQSVRVLRNQKGLVRRLASGGSYHPDRLLAGLAHFIDDPELNVPGFHLFSFNHVKETEAWRTGMISRLEAGAGAARAC